MWMGTAQASVGHPSLMQWVWAGRASTATSNAWPWARSSCPAYFLICMLKGQTRFGSRGVLQANQSTPWPHSAPSMGPQLGTTRVGQWSAPPRTPNTLPSPPRLPPSCSLGQGWLLSPSVLYPTCPSMKQPLPKSPKHSSRMAAPTQTLCLRHPA